MALSVDEKLIARLDEFANRRDELNEQLSDPEIACDPNKSISLAKEIGRMKRLVDPYLAFRKVREDLQGNQEIAQDSSQDPELRDMASEELGGLKTQHDQMLEGLKELIVTDEDAAISSIIVEVRAGTGGQEAALFARNLYEMYLRYCERQGFKLEVLDQSAAEMGGLKEIVLNIKGPGVYRALGYEGGGHRVQRVPETEAQGRVHTSAATVAVLPEPDEVNVSINWEKDVEEFVSRSGGPGGQNVNKVSSAIRLCHIETGIVVSMRDEKSQHKNRAKARRLMTTRVYDSIITKKNAARADVRKNMIGSGDRSQRIRTYNFPQNRCTDHRIGLDLHCLEKVMQGDLDQLIDALQTHDKEQRLQDL